MKNSALILEGGGMRGIFTSGVLDAFLEKDIHLPYVIGVSMGAYTGASYITNQKCRNKEVLIDCISSDDFFDIKRVFTNESILHSDFVFIMMNKFKNPFDYCAFNRSTKRFLSVATNVETGRPHYFEKDKINCFEKTLKASCAYPGLTDFVKINDISYIDGGVSDPIPYKKALLDGNKKLLIVLTHPKGYVEKSPWYLNASSVVYKEYPNLVEILKKRHEKYNKTLKELERLEEKGVAYIIRPDTDISILTRDFEKLNKSYSEGYEKVIKQTEEIQLFLNG